MKLILLSQNSVKNFTKVNNKIFDINLDDDIQTVVIKDILLNCFCKKSNFDM